MPSHPKQADIPALVAKLCDADIEFIIVGGAAAVLQGAPITTTDLDIVHRRTPENVARLHAGRPKDRLALSVLIATLQERDKANE